MKLISKNRIIVKMVNVVLLGVPKEFLSLDGSQIESLIILNQLGVC